MRVALTMRVVEADGYRESRDAISQDWITWLEGRNHVPQPIPNVLVDPVRYLAAVGAEAVILTGGNDLIPRPGAVDDTSATRDRTEFAIIESAIANQLPVFGVCRGLHTINCYFGGALETDIAGGKVDHAGANHMVAVEKSFVGLAAGNRIQTNSFHNQGVARGQAAPNLEVFATSEGDGLVEGLFHPTAPVLAIQWHPERPGPSAAFDNALFGRFLKEGAFWCR